MTTADEYAQALLTKGGWPITMEKRIAIVAWGLAEGVPTEPRFSGATWNILDSEEPAPGATDFNPAGVKNYPDLASGVAAVEATLRDGYYNATILPVLADEGASAEALAQAVGRSPWGTGDFTRTVELVKADPERYLGMEVPGSTAPVQDAGSSASTPAPPSPPHNPLEVHEMAAEDPISGGTWVADETGAVYAFDGAPYLGGLNAHPEWGAGGSADPCVGIAPWKGDGTDQGGNGYVLVCQSAPGQTPTLYRFPRSAVYAQAQQPHTDPAPAPAPDPTPAPPATPDPTPTPPEGAPS